MAGVSLEGEEDVAAVRGLRRRGGDCAGGASLGGIVWLCRSAAVMPVMVWSWLR